MCRLIWLAVWSSSTSTWRGVFPNSRSSWVSVSILVGIRLRMAIFRGRMSWVWARSWVITKIFSDSRTSMAGRSAWMRMGIVSQPFKKGEKAAELLKKALAFPCKDVVK